MKPKEKINPLDAKRWQRGGRQNVLGTYLELHKDKLGQYRLYAAADRIAAGDDEGKVMADYGYELKENRNDKS